MPNLRSPHTVSIALSLTVALIAICVVISPWLATAAEPPQFTPEEVAAAKKHADFAALSSAKGVVVGKIKVSVVAVLESFPAIYELRMVVTPTEVIFGNAEVGKPLVVSFSRRAKEEPKFKDVPYLVAVGAGKTTRPLVLLKPGSDDLTKLAKIASTYGAAQRAKNAKLARDNPEMHPLFEQLEQAKRIVVLLPSSDPSGGVSFDARTRLEEHYNVTVVHSLRGDMKPGLLKRLSYTENATAFSKPQIAVVEMRDGEPVVTWTLLAGEEQLRVTAAAVDMEPDALLKIVAKAQANNKRKRGGDGKAATEPSSGESRSSCEVMPE